MEVTGGIFNFCRIPRGEPDVHHVERLVGRGVAEAAVMDGVEPFADGLQGAYCNFFRGNRN
jgi:hypothetical protein